MSQLALTSWNEITLGIARVELPRAPDPIAATDHFIPVSYPPYRATYRKDHREHTRGVCRSL